MHINILQTAFVKEDIVQKVIEMGIDVKAKDEQGKTALDLALKIGDQKIISLLQGLSLFNHLLSNI
jgi:hypothetical protein